MPISLLEAQVHVLPKDRPENLGCKSFEHSAIKRIPIANRTLGILPGHIPSCMPVAVATGPSTTIGVVIRVVPEILGRYAKRSTPSSSGMSTHAEHPTNRNTFSWNNERAHKSSNLVTTRGSVRWVLRLLEASSSCRYGICRCNKDGCILLFVEGARARVNSHHMQHIVHSTRDHCRTEFFLPTRDPACHKT
jgi:hypothetical protein